MPTPWVPTPNQLSDGQDVSAEVLNPVLQQYTNRTQYLKEQLEAVTNKSALVAFDQLLVSNSIIAGNIVSFTTVGGVQKLDLSKVDYATSGTDSSFSPNNSSYVFGIVKQVKQVGNVYTADVYLHGLITLSNVSNLLAANETLVPGPYFLSRKEPGKLTSDPSGIAIFVGFAKSSTEFYLNPQTDLLNQLFLNYRFLLLDRHISTVAPVNSGGHISLVLNDMNKVGWTSASSAGCVIPAGAAYFYNLPSDTLIDTDPSMTDVEKAEAKLLKKAMPFYPSAFNMLNINCCLQLYKSAGDSATLGGKYTIDQNGIWWYDNSNTGTQPWSIGVPSSVDAHPYWADTVHIATASRKFTTLYATKLNPELRTVTVTSLQPYKDANNDSSGVIQFYDANNKTGAASSGDLLAKYNLGSNIIDLTSGGQTEKNVAVKSVLYNPQTGVLDTKVGKVVTSITGSGIINVTEIAPNTGKYVISTVTPATSGQVTDIEPDNAVLEFLGLHSYLKLGIHSAVPMGLFGKIMLPSVIPATDLSLSLLVMGVLSNPTVTLQMLYSVSAPGSLGATYTNTSVSFGTVVNTPSTITHANFKVPASVLVPGAVVNFKLNRTDSNTGDLGIIGIYWQLA